jgi:hypothetical protein
MPDATPKPLAYVINRSYQPFWGPTLSRTKIPQESMRGVYKAVSFVQRCLRAGELGTPKTVRPAPLEGCCNRTWLVPAADVKAEGP